MLCCVYIEQVWEVETFLQAVCERCVLRAVSVFSVAVRGLSVLCCVYIEQVWVETFLQAVW